MKRTQCAFSILSATCAFLPVSPAESLAMSKEDYCKAVARHEVNNAKESMAADVGSDQADDSYGLNSGGGDTDKSRKKHKAKNAAAGGQNKKSKSNHVYRQVFDQCMAEN
ncbi:hypothetical protein [Aestuariivirga sp.]|uniref:hypothetical protein n=1 Tax=Aestuariivirga sp. TaxID=2650926 RepID=UPI0039E34A52